MVGGLGGDPFSLYYGYYLPQQAALAAQATPLDTINAATAARIPVVIDRPESDYSRALKSIAGRLAQQVSIATIGAGGRA